ncbi:protein kinase-like domain, concanavalin A-like lectin/glucanase domain protein [Tanacetum coccineum]
MGWLGKNSQMIRTYKTFSNRRGRNGIPAQEHMPHSHLLWDNSSTPYDANCVETGRHLIRVILLLGLSAGVVTILIIIILCLKKNYVWRKKAEYNVNVEIFLKNQEFLAPKRGELRDGNLVAIKILSELKGNGKDFVNEVASVGRTCYVNIVSLMGFCLEGLRRALIYEFMPNGSLEEFIYDHGSSSNSHLG